MVYFALPPASIIIQGAPMVIPKIIYIYLSEFFWNWEILQTNWHSPASQMVFSSLPNGILRLPTGILWLPTGIFRLPTGILRLRWLRFIRIFSSVVRQMPGYTSQRRGTVRTLPN